MTGTLSSATTKTCYRCKVEKPLDQFTKNNRPNSPECKDCKSQRMKTHRAKPEIKLAQSVYHKRRRVAQIAKLSGNYEAGIQTCATCDFTGESRMFAKDKASPTGHMNRCLQCNNRFSKASKDRHRELTRERNRDYKVRNREKINSYTRLYHQSRPERRLIRSVRRSISRALFERSKGGRSLELLGVRSIDEYRRYLENLFELGMSCENYGNGLSKWNIDHKKPLFQFDLTKASEQRKAFHYLNTRPMWQSENGSNGSIARFRKQLIKSTQPFGGQ